MVDSGKASLDRLFKNTNNNNNFDIVIINTHLFDMPGIDIAKETHRKNQVRELLL